MFASKQYGVGLVVGKFAPVHNGHHYLINRAMDMADQVYVLVVDDQLDGVIPMTALERVAIINEVHPGVIVKVMPNILCDDNSEYWAEYTREFLGFVPDAVFTSEDYGNPWSKALGCDHVLVDHPRAVHPVSGTMVREDPLSMRAFLHPATWALLVKRVVVLGAESTGTTTLSNALGEHYRTEVVPEFGRLRDEEKVRRDGKPYDWPSGDFVYTARVQQAIEDRMARNANKVLICDTDALATHLWHERYLGTYSREVFEIAYERFQDHDLYILTSPEGIEPEDDGFRFEMHRREEMHECFLDLLDTYHLPYIVVTGTHEQRMAQATEAVDKLLYAPVSV